MSMKKGLYPAVILVTGYLNMMYKWPAGDGVLAAELVFPIICMVIVCLVKRRICAEIVLQKDVAEQKEVLPVQIRVKNTSFFPATVKMVLRYRYLADKTVKKTCYRVYVAGGGQVVRDSSLIAEYCGKLEIGIRKIKVYDCWGFFSLSRKCKETQSIVVMPKPYPVNLTVSNTTKWFPIDGESYARDRSGDDSAEIYEVREYRAGDRLQKVHWKLSAKEDTLYIKEFSYPLGAAVALLMEGAGVGEHRKIAGNQFVEAVISISMALVEKECAHYVVWRLRREQMINRRLIRDEEDFYRFLSELLELDPDSLDPDVEEYYRYEYKNETYSTRIKISTGLMLKINKQECMDIQGQGIETFFETVELVV